MSKQTRHTPGPWITVMTDGDDIAAEYFRDSYSAHHRSVEASEITDGTWTGVVIPLRLAASAPDLLAALRGMLEWARRVHGPNPGPEVAAAVAAINLAEGGAK